MWCTQATTSYKMTMCHNCSSSNVLEIFTQPMSQPQPQPRTTIVAPNCYNMIQFNSWQSKATHVMHASHKIHILNIPWSAFTILKGRIFIRSLIYSHFQSSTSPTMSSPSLSSSPSLKSYIEKWPPACASVVCYLVYVTPPSAPLLFIAHCWNVFLTREIDKAMK